MGVTVPESGLGVHDDTFIQGKPSLPGKQWIMSLVFDNICLGPNLTRPQTPDLLVLPRWLCHPSQAPAAGICHRWLKACSSSAEPEPLGPCEKQNVELLSPAE